MNHNQGYWQGPLDSLCSSTEAFQQALAYVGRPVYVVKHKGETAVTQLGTIRYGKAMQAEGDDLPLLGYVPALRAEDLGDSTFKKDIGLRYAYVVGAMANGITSVQMVTAAARTGAIGFFGAGGLPLDQVERAVAQLQTNLHDLPFGFNLIHSPNEPELEAAVVELYLRRGVRLISASAFLGITPPLVYFRVKGIRQMPDGSIVCPNHVIAKVSREEVARKFFAPPPEGILAELVRQNKISSTEAELARRIPLAQDMTAEADSGGHTDNRPALSMFPTFLALRDEAVQRFEFRLPLRVGLGGGIATPTAAAAAFSMGAAYILTGSINQACIEADTSAVVRTMLSQTQQADVVMAPAGDMFELGARVQVLKRGTMFAMRAAKLYELYRVYSCYEEIPPKERQFVEQELLKKTFDQAWRETCTYFNSRNPAQIERAAREPRHKMALVFRSYLGLSSLWAKQGVPQRQIDYQIWCGPAMGAFNAWTKNSFLEKPEKRRIDIVALNLLYGAAGLTRCHWLRSQGVDIPDKAARFSPLPAETILKKERL